MKKKQRIQQLEAKVAELESRLAALEPTPLDTLLKDLTEVRYSGTGWHEPIHVYTPSEAQVDWGDMTRMSKIPSEPDSAYMRGYPQPRDYNPWENLHDIYIPGMTIDLMAEGQNG